MVIKINSKNKPLKMDKHVVPGEILGVIEEFLPGKNCYEENGQVIASTWGFLVKNPDRTVSVIPHKRVLLPKRGYTAIGFVTEVRKSKAIVLLSHFKGKDNKFHPLKTDFFAFLNVFSLSDRFIRSMHDAVRPGDYIICKVLQTIPENRVGLIGSREFGVIYAICYNCGNPVSKKIKRNVLRCDHCGATQNRVLSTFFGKLDQIPVL